MSALLPTLVALAWLVYFAPGSQVVAQLAAARAGQPALQVRAALSTAESDAPASLAIDLHPEFGIRVADDRGGRWVVQRGRVLAGTQLPPPLWLPELEVLALRHESDLQSWLGVQGIDVSANELARCGDGDCYVLGTRQSLAQLWVDKRSFEVRRIVLPGRGQSQLEEWRSFDKLRFPSRIEISGDQGSATLAVESVSSAPRLSAADFSEAWVRAAPPSSRR
ncbi:MAG: hypothetical protein WEF50_00845 [Myxococcota bacterium]